MSILVFGTFIKTIELIHANIGNNKYNVITIPLAQPATQAPSTSNQQAATNQQTSTGTVGTGSCGCTGSSIKPPGSEKTCTQFPCLIFEDNFDTLNLDVWEHEITASGGGVSTLNY